MAVGLAFPTKLLPVKGVRLSTASAKMYNKVRDDVALIELCTGAKSAVVLTKNKFCAAPVIVAKQHMNTVMPRFCLINAGNANAGTGQSGIVNAETLCRAVASLVSCEPTEILPFSTGVIGEDLPVEKIKQVLPELVEQLTESSWLDLAEAIMTTDTVPKAFSEQLNIDGETITITGVAKGSGMIKPNMATMLSYIATDANISKAMLDRALSKAVKKSFNRITVDGDTSTNDACMLFSTAKVDHLMIEYADSDEYMRFETALIRIAQKLAQAIVRDGEGASKFITIDVIGGKDDKECLKIAYKIAESPLVKTAMTASDPNWGRILAAIGNAGITDLDVDKINVYLGDICIVKSGRRAENYTEKSGKQVMLQAEIQLIIQLNRGDRAERIWTTDLSHDYVTINAEYRT